MMIGMGCSADLNLSSFAGNVMDDAAPKKFVLFVQPEPLRRIRFMELYRNGLVAY